MRVPLSWLADYVDLELAPRELAERLTVLGFEVKAVEQAGGDWSGVVVGRVLAVERHPNADTLWLTRVDAGGPEPLEIVCGAQNLACRSARPGRGSRRHVARRAEDRADEDPRRGVQRDAVQPDRARAGRRRGRDSHPGHRRRASGRGGAGDGHRGYRARRRRQAQPGRRAVDGGPGPRDRGRDRHDRSLARGGARRAGAADRGCGECRDPGWRPVPALHCPTAGRGGDGR